MRSVNISVGETNDRMMMTGMHTVANISCVGCGSIVGWKYEYVQEKSQKYKEGKFILERTSILSHTTSQDTIPVTLEGSKHGGTSSLSPFQIREYNWTSHNAFAESKRPAAYADTLAYDAMQSIVDLMWFLTVPDRAPPPVSMDEAMIALEELMASGHIDGTFFIKSLKVLIDSPAYRRPFLKLKTDKKVEFLATIISGP
ncbi:hypothetical protein GIB67_027453 [Kingdonia uniflora]|uniref:Yippee domain-containing protein n=1 Tax=Kingdonia uniflora TaxID=39325 RepID=A0A7J7MFB8_9MAGN|nr:hypothetical protein GIB67_027453 [Kingdonia uniflora]